MAHFNPNSFSFEDSPCLPRRWLEALSAESAAAAANAAALLGDRRATPGVLELLMLDVLAQLPPRDAECTAGDFLLSGVAGGNRLT
mmetsp:Transcript_1731/g.2414  ORF Transcript_1731/g.2414 Transcript_1731/m.2414 type:complete len:86 (-) Transcript_1731:4-261(-)